jgi:aminopeptidase N
MKSLGILCLFAAAFSNGVAGKPYFQQAVNYDITVNLDPETARLAGTEALIYFNNSPDTLREIYFHLYYNSSSPGSYMDRQAQERGDYDKGSTPLDKIGYMEISLIKNDGFPVDNFLIDNTIMQVPLHSFLLPGDSTYIYLEFSAQIPSEGPRAARRGKHFDVGQWYPKPAVYDKHGWHKEQHLSRGEFFGEYGNFSVELTLPEDFIVAHCGSLLNEEEIFGERLPVPDSDSIIVDALKYLKGGGLTDTLSYVSKSDEELQTTADTSAIIQKAQELKTWKIRAENIHDFAFGADPEFAIDICRYNDTIIKSYYTKSTEKRWRRNAADYTRKALKFYSEKYFPWPYTQYSLVSSEVSGGMEYPDMSMISGKYGAANPYDHGLESTIAHEVGHAWFYGILGSNETEEAFLDEGLTSYATVKYMEHYYGRFENNFSYEKKWQKLLLPNGNQRNDEQSRYIRNALTRTEDPTDTPAEKFRDWRSYYIASYFKSSSVYLMLQQVLGEVRFDTFLRALFERWAFKHPYFDDFQALAEEQYDGDLRWFFAQWFNNTWTLDYGIDFIKSRNDTLEGRTGYRTTVGIKNHGRCIMPLELCIEHKHAAPDTLKVPVDVWEKGVSSFDTTVFLTSPPTKVTIDPGLMLADVNRMNNSMVVIGELFSLQLLTAPVTFQFMVPNFVYRKNYIEYLVDSYRIAHYPTLWYNSLDGAQVGYAFKGAYLQHFRRADLSVAAGLQSGKINYLFRYGNPIPAFHPMVSLTIGSREWEGRGRQEIGLLYDSDDTYAMRSTVAGISLQRNYFFKPEYIYANSWSSGNVVSGEVNLFQKYSSRFGEFDVQGNVSTGTFGSDYNFRRIAGGLSVFVAGIGAGETNFMVKVGRADGDIPLQRRFFLSSADPYDIWDSPLFRSRGTLPDRWLEDGYLFKPGGAGLAGYLEKGITGTRLFSTKITTDLPRLDLPLNIPYLTKEIARIAPEIYAVAGKAWSADNDIDFLYEAGAVLEYQIPYLSLFISESRLRLFLPLWLSDVDQGQDKFMWRWIFSITP